MRNGIDFSVSVNRDKLSDILEEAIDQALQEEPLEVNSVTVQMKRVGNTTITPNGRNIRLVLPYKIDLQRSAGLFGMEASGGLHLVLDIAYDITSDFKIKSHTSLVKYGWIEKPQIEIGVLNIPLEKIIDMVIKHYESIITGKIDSAIRQNAQVQELIKNALIAVHEKISEMDTKGMDIQLRLKELQLVEPELDAAGDINIVGRIDTHISISDAPGDEPYNPVTYAWINDYKKTDHALSLDAVVSYGYISRMILEQANEQNIGDRKIKVTDVQVAHVNNEMKIVADITEPINGEAIVTGIPTHNDITGELFLEDVHVKVNFSNIIYKLTAPLVNGFIESKIEELFPLDLNGVIKEKVEPMIPKDVDIPHGKAELLFDAITVDHLEFLDEHIIAKVSVNDLNVIGTIR